MAVVGLGARSYVRSTDWVSGEVFYRRTIDADGGSVRVILNLGQIYAAKEQYALAEHLLRKALDLCPDLLDRAQQSRLRVAAAGKKWRKPSASVAATAQAPEARKEYPRTWMACSQPGAHACAEDNDEAALWRFSPKAGGIIPTCGI